MGGFVAFFDPRKRVFGPLERLGFLWILLGPSRGEGGTPEAPNGPEGTPRKPPKKRSSNFRALKKGPEALGDDFGKQKKKSRASCMSIVDTERLPKS